MPQLSFYSYTENRCCVGATTLILSYLLIVTLGVVVGVTGQWAWLLA